MVKCKVMLPQIVVTKDARSPGPEAARCAVDNGVAAHHVYTVVLPEGKRELIIDQLREIQILAVRRIGAPRLFVLCDFDTAADQAQNVLLKTLEEAAEDDYFLLYAQSLYRILPTIRSRCTIRNQSGKQVSTVRPDMERFVDRLVRDRFFYLSDPLSAALNTDSAPLFLDELLLALREHVTRRGTTAAMRELMRVKSLIMHNNANPQLAVDAALDSAQSHLFGLR